MAENITLNNIATFVNDTTAVNTYNSNNSAIVNAFNDVLSRSGVSPNQMQSTLDMNNNQIINLPFPTTANSPARLIDIAGGQITVVTATTGTSGHTVPFLDGANTWTGTSQSFNTGIIETLTNPSGFTTSNVFNSFSVATDNLDASGVGNNAANLNVFYGFGGSSTKGSRAGLTVNAQLLSATSASNTSRFYTGGVFQVQAISGDGGGVGTEKGQFFGVNPVAILNAAATNTVQLAGGEVNVQATTGSSTLNKYGWMIVQNASDAVSGSVNDAGILLANQAGAVNWKNGIQFGDNSNQFPVKTTGTLIKSNSGSVSLGVDFSTSTFSVAAFQSPGFFVNGIGSIVTGTAGFANGALQFNGQTSGSTLLSVNTTGNLLTISQPAQIGVVGTTGGAITLAGLTSGSATLSVSSTGGVLQSANNFLTTGTLSTGGVGTVSGQLTFVGSTSGSVALTTPAASAGMLQFSSSGSFSANGAVATALTSVGPTGSHTTVQTWLTIVDNTGATRYIPCF